LLLSIGQSLDAILVLAVSSCVFFLDSEPVWLWRASVVRGLRLARVWKFAGRFEPMKELWLVLLGLRKCFKALAVFAIILGLIVWAGAAGVTGLVNADSVEVCSSATEPEAEDTCLDMYERFGSVSRSFLTLMQLVTLDGWASKVVRPMSSVKPLAAMSLAIFSVLAAYCLVSIITGIIVRSTVDLAMSHPSHASQIALTEDLDTIHQLTEYFRQSLILDNREALTARDFRDSWGAPQVAQAVKKLDLPITDPEELFEHLDKTHIGTVSVEDFDRGLVNMKRPATRYDVACLTATIGGSVTYTGRIARRANRFITNMDELRFLLGTSFAELSQLAGGEEEESKQNVPPEIFLRQSHAIFNPEPPEAPRYTT